MMNVYPISYFRSLPDRAVDRILFCCGLFLSASELYKQLFLYYIINQGRYDWWYFPFQLCSLPMYFCLLLPFLPACRVKAALYTFMRDYHFMAGIAALIVPEGFSHIHWTLTLHGYAWHILLVLISLFIWLAGRGDLSRRGFLHTLPLFAACCGIATAINFLAPGQGRADMFYISPFYPNTQLVFHGLALQLGIHLANILYLAAICLGGFLVHQLYHWGERRIRPYLVRQRRPPTAPSPLSSSSFAGPPDSKPHGRQT